MKLTCVNVCKQAWNDEKITLQSDDTTVIIHLKNPDEHGQFSQGEQYTIELDDDVVAKPLSKKAKKQAKAKKAAKKIGTVAKAVSSLTKNKKVGKVADVVGAVADVLTN